MTVGGNLLLPELGSSTLIFALHLTDLRVFYVSHILIDAVPGLGCCTAVKLFPGFVLLGLPASQPDVGTSSWAPYILMGSWGVRTP